MYMCFLYEFVCIKHISGLNTVQIQNNKILFWYVTSVTRDGQEISQSNNISKLIYLIKMY